MGCDSCPGSSELLDYNEMWKAGKVWAGTPC